MFYVKNVKNEKNIKMTSNNKDCIICLTSKKCLSLEKVCDCRTIFICSDCVKKDPNKRCPQCYKQFKLESHIKKTRSCNINNLFKLLKCVTMFTISIITLVLIIYKYKNCSSQSDSDCIFEKYDIIYFSAFGLLLNMIIVIIFNDNFILYLQFVLFALNIFYILYLYPLNKYEGNEDMSFIQSWMYSSLILIGTYVIFLLIYFNLHHIKHMFCTYIPNCFCPYKDVEINQIIPDENIIINVNRNSNTSNNKE